MKGIYQVLPACMAGNVFTISVDHLLGGAVFCCNVYGIADAAHIKGAVVQDFLALNFFFFMNLPYTRPRFRGFNISIFFFEGNSTCIMYQYCQRQRPCCMETVLRKSD
jgi:hypothetical protein